MRDQDKKAIITKLIKKYCKLNTNILKVPFLDEADSKVYGEEHSSSKAVVTIDPTKSTVRLRIGLPYAGEHSDYDQDISIKGFSDYVVRNSRFKLFLSQLNLEIQRGTY